MAKNGMALILGLGVVYFLSKKKDIPQVMESLMVVIGTMNKKPLQRMNHLVLIPALVEMVPVLEMVSLEDESGLMHHQLRIV